MAPTENFRTNRSRENDLEASLSGNGPDEASLRKGDEETPVAPRVCELIRRVKNLGPVHDANWPPVETLHRASPGLDTLAASLSGLGNELVAPSCIGRFRVEKLLGKGGFGLVYKAFDPDLDRKVAIKIPRLDVLTSPESLARFVREARAVALLGHPGVVPVFEVGQTGPVPYMVMALIEGGNLAQWIQVNGKELANRSVALLMIALAEATQHAHSRGIIHRDLKPANVLLHSENASPIREENLAGCARISDFGMAIVNSDDGLATQSGAMIGTPVYMAPEQVCSGREPVRTTTDVYGLGAIMYELLAGKPPFAGDSFVEILRQVEAVPPVSPRRINPAVPADIEAICLKCLEKQPSRRYSSAADLAADLQRFVDGVPVRARRPRGVERLARWVNRNRAVSTAAFVAFAALCIGLGTSIRQAGIARSNFHESERQRVRAESHLARAEKAIDQMLNEVADVLASVPGLETLRERVLHKALEFETELAVVEGDDPDIRMRAARAHGKVAEIQLKLGDVDNALQSLDTARVLLDAIVSDRAELADQKRRLLTHFQLMTGNALAAKGKYREVGETVAPVAQFFSGMNVEHPDPEELRTWSGALSLLGRAQSRQGKATEAEASYMLSAEVLSRIPETMRVPKDRIQLAMNWNSLANLHRMNGNLQDAIAAYESSIRSTRELLNADAGNFQLRSNLLLAMLNLASARVDGQDFGQALADYEDALPEAGHLLDQCPAIARHQQFMLSALCGKAVCLEKSGGDLELAHAAYRDAIRFGEDLVNRGNPTPEALQDLSSVLGNFGNLLYRGLKRPEEALPVFEKQIAIARKLVEDVAQPGNHQWALSLALGNLGEFYLEQENPALAEPLHREGEAVALENQARTPRSEFAMNRLAWHRQRLGYVLCRTGKLAEALDKAIAIGEIDPVSSKIQMVSASAIAHIHGWIKEQGDLVVPEGFETTVREKLADSLRAAARLGWNDKLSVREVVAMAGIGTDPLFQEIVESIPDRP